VLPDLRLDRRAGSLAPASVAAGAKPVGRWTIIQRKDGIKQWYDEAPLHIALDQQPGDVFGGSADTRVATGRPPANPSGGAGCAARLGKNNECRALLVTNANTQSHV
jgi:hypothetical protein